LVAQEGEKLKSISITKLSNLLTLDTHFKWDANIDKQLTEDDGIWLSDAKQEVVLKVRAEVAGYFKRRKLIANQVIEKELEDGGLIISAKIGHTNQIIRVLILTNVYFWYIGLNNQTQATQ